MAAPTELYFCGHCNRQLQPVQKNETCSHCGSRTVSYNPQKESEREAAARWKRLWG